MPDEPSLELPSVFRRKQPDTREQPPKPRQLPALPAALLAGATIGLLTAGFVWLALRGCSDAFGTSSCGDPGILVLLAIFVVMVVAGRVLLTFLGVPHAGSTGFLGVTLMALVTLVLADDLDGPFGAVVLAIAGAAAFAVSQWVTSTFDEPGDRPR